MSRAAAAFVVASILLAPGSVLAAETQRPPQGQATLYFPDRNDWQRRKPEDIGMDPALLDQAVKSAIANENPLTKDMAFYLATTFGAHEPLDTPIGPIKDRGPAAGLVTRNGYIVAEWGDPTRVDMTFSVTKTFVTAPASAVWFQGNSDNIVYIDWENDVVAVVRWIKPGALNEFVGKMVSSIKTPSKKAAGKIGPHPG